MKPDSRPHAWGFSPRLPLVTLSTFIAASAAHDLMVPPEYRATAMFAIIDRPIGNQTKAEAQARDFAKYFDMMCSDSIIVRVQGRLSDSDRSAATRPHFNEVTYGTPNPEFRILKKHREIAASPENPQKLVTISYTASSVPAAVRITTYFVEEIQKAEDESVGLPHGEFEMLVLKVRNLREALEKLRQDQERLRQNAPTAPESKHEEIEREIRKLETELQKALIPYDEEKALRAGLRASRIRLIESATAEERPVNRALIPGLIAGLILSAMIFIAQRLLRPRG